MTDFESDREGTSRHFYPDHPGRPLVAYEDYRKLLERVENIEARQRIHKIHDPECSVSRAQIHNRKGQTYQIPGECTCWLSEPTTPPREKIIYD